MNIQMLSFLLFFLHVNMVFSQNQEAVPDLTAAEFNNKVLISWTLNQGNTCNGIDILRSTDGVNFEEIGNIEGVCGSPESSIPYNFTDLSPEKNAVNYYRLKLGGLGFTYIVSAEVWDLGGYNYIVRPNPLNDATELLFNNDFKTETVLNVYNSKGIIVHTDRTTTEKFVLDKSQFDAGMHFFEIETTERIIQGRFIVN